MIAFEEEAAHSNLFVFYRCHIFDPPNQSEWADGRDHEPQSLVALLTVVAFRPRRYQHKLLLGLGGPTKGAHAYWQCPAPLISG